LLSDGQEGSVFDRATTLSDTVPHFSFHLESF
jgi:hypothetical protein